jgi:hypothetical protein
MVGVGQKKKSGGACGEKKAFSAVAASAKHRAQSVQAP